MPRDNLVSLAMTAIDPVPLAAWSGSAAAAWLYDALPEGSWLLRVSPLLSRGPRGEPRPIVSGVRGRRVVLEPGTVVELEAVVRGDATLLLARLPSALAQRGLDLVEARVEQVSLDAPPPPAGSPTFVVEVRYFPTMHTFRGHRVLYPSPARLLSGAARTLGEITGSNLRSAVPQLLQGFELLGHRTRIVELSIGRGRVVKAFHGTAIYAADRRVAHEVLRLIQVARIYGTGKSRGIGFGTIEYRIAR